MKPNVIVCVGGGGGGENKEIHYARTGIHLHGCIIRPLTS